MFGSFDTISCQIFIFMLRTGILIHGIGIDGFPFHLLPIQDTYVVWMSLITPLLHTEAGLRAMIGEVLASECTFQSVLLLLM